MPHTCPIAKAARIIGDLWSILIIRDLLPGVRRFNELQCSMVNPDTGAKINTRTLTGRLKMLESMGVLTRTHYPHAKPPKTEYALTEQGRELHTIIEDLRSYGEKYFSSGDCSSPA